MLIFENPTTSTAQPIGYTFIGDAQPLFLGGDFYVERSTPTDILMMLAVGVLLSA